MPRDEEPAPEPTIDWARFDGLYAPGPVKFFNLIRAWRAEGMEGLDIR